MAQASTSALVGHWQEAADLWGQVRKAPSLPPSPPPAVWKEGPVGFSGEGGTRWSSSCLSRGAGDGGIDLFVTLKPEQVEGRGTSPTPDRKRLEGRAGVPPTGEGGGKSAQTSSSAPTAACRSQLYKLLLLLWLNSVNCNYDPLYPERNSSTFSPQLAAFAVGLAAGAPPCPVLSCTVGPLLPPPPRVHAKLLSPSLATGPSSSAATGNP